jgi:hypothetical protein
MACRVSEILILEQKNLRVSDELGAHKKQQDKVLRCINNLHSQLTVMGDNFVKTKGLKVNMDKDNEVLRQDYVYKLKVFLGLLRFSWGNNVVWRTRSSSVSNWRTKSRRSKRTK